MTFVAKRIRNLTFIALNIIFTVGLMLYTHFIFQFFTMLEYLECDSQVHGKQRWGWANGGDFGP
ncbi:hypothetical protein BU16DRAFT_532041 [Lophium mytilinum]|uniref:Uncharacterized protein n=1 Tax=Lophium mytilinum TaxID=390894 RepID=A0A6A6Q9C7_9PEZI|nr:hypothetical protein BU16DRAFT_532041 [Lophium mytilinum]